jgi:hypothetical protein
MSEWHEGRSEWLEGRSALALLVVGLKASVIARMREWDNTREGVTSGAVITE